jgi:hypothetical protein
MLSRCQRVQQPEHGTQRHVLRIAQVLRPNAL